MQRLATHRADLTIRAPGGEVRSEERVSVRVKDGVARASRGGATLAQTDGVLEVQDVGRRHWSVKLADGSEWDVVVRKNCGCS